MPPLAPINSNPVAKGDNTLAAITWILDSSSNTCSASDTLEDTAGRLMEGPVDGGRDITGSAVLNLADLPLILTPSFSENGDTEMIRSN